MDENLEPTAPEPAQIDGFSRAAERERESIFPDRILSAVGDEHRRVILDSLNNASNQKLAYDTLVDRVADRMRDEYAELASDEHRQRIWIALHHNHLPKLEEVGIIDYETETGQVVFVGGELAQDLLTLIGKHRVSE